jgi:hypothetical protein
MTTLTAAEADEISLLRWADDGGSCAEHELEQSSDIYVTILKEAAEALRSRPLGLLLGGSPIEGKFVAVQQGRGARFSRRGTRRFFGDPNLVAAVIAALCIDDIDDWRGSDSRSKRQRPHRVRRADGSISSTQDAAARYAVKLINRYYVPLLPDRDRMAKSDTVKGLLKHGRTNWPSDDSKRPSND